jgi:thiol-disulfide isomerase/thioredoxin
MRGFLLAALAFLLSPALFSQNLEWEEAPQFEVELNGKADFSARAYQPTASKPFMLLFVDNVKTPILLDLSTKKVTELATKDVIPGREYTVTSKGIPAGKPVGSYALKGGATVFPYRGKTVALRMKDALVGEVPLGVLLAHSPVYTILRNAYKVKKAPLAFIAAYAKPVKIVVMFATWCPTCKRVVPHFLRILQDAANPNISVRYIGIAMGGSEPQKELNEFGHDYPAFIVFKNGKEVGRLVGEPTVSIEEYLVNLLKK